MKYTIRFGVLLVLLTFVIPFSLIAQDSFIAVQSYDNKNVSGMLFYREKIGEDDRTGNDLVFDSSGNAFVFQWDQNLLYKLGSDITVKSVITFPENVPRIIKRLVNADGKILLFLNYYGIESAYDFQGNSLFEMNIWDLMQEPVVSIGYFANILFLVDRKGRLYSVLSPSMDQEKNAANFRDPEQTKKLFEPGSGVDLQGLTMDVKGLLYVNGKQVYLTVENVGDFRYQYLQNNFYINATGKSETVVSVQTNPDEILESTAIHPSGDIYFLKYNKNTDKHILYRIDNTWDPAFRAEWYRKAAARETADAAALKATVNDNNVRIRKQPTLTGTELGKLQKGNVVTVLEKSSQPMKIDTMNAYWYRIKTDAGLEGWSYGAFLDIQK